MVLLPTYFWPIVYGVDYGRDTELECQHAGCKGCAKVHDGRDE